MIGSTRAICHTSANGIMHRDIKPENILFRNKTLESENDVVLADFGLS
mgnify:CR=1 FL=1